MPVLSIRLVVIENTGESVPTPSALTGRLPNFRTICLSFVCPSLVRTSHPKQQSIAVDLARLRM